MKRQLTQLSSARASKYADCRYVTPLEELKQVVADIESGVLPAPDQMFIAFLTKDPKRPDHYKTIHRCAGANFRDLVALLEIAKDDLLNQ